MIEHEEQNKYIKIRKDILWKILAVFIILFLTGTLIFQIYKSKSVKSETEYVDVTYEHLTSKLTDKTQCFICGSPKESLMPYYRKFDTIGVISFNDQYVFDLGLKSYDGTGEEIESSTNSSIHSTHLDNVAFSLNSIPSRGMSHATITLPKNYKLDTEILEENFCTDCLAKVAATLEHSYCKGDKKETIPLCLIDFDTLELYSLQGLYTGYFVRDYWIELDSNENEIELSAYYLPVRNE